MKGTVPETVEQRLGRLERDARSWKSVSLLCFVALATVGWMEVCVASRGSTRVVEAETFILRDAHGNARAMLNADADGAVGLAFTDKDEKEYLSLGVARAGGMGVKFRDKNGRVQAGMGVLSDGSPFVIPHVTRHSDQSPRDDLLCSGACPGLRERLSGWSL